MGKKRRLSPRLMCWHTVTLCLNPKLFFFPSGSEGVSKSKREREREVNLRRCSCLPWLLWIGCFLKLSKCFTASCLCRDSVRVHTCEGSRATERAWPACLPACLAWPHLSTELSYSKPQALHNLPGNLCSPTALNPGTQGRTKAAAPLFTAGLGVLCFLFMNGDFASGAVPLRRYLDYEKTRAFLQSTIHFHQHYETFMEETQESGVF